MPAARIDFKHIRQHADIAAVMAHYGIELQKDGSRADQFKGLCPFHKDSRPSLKVNTAKGIYNCFPCEAGGNVLDFVQAMDGGSLRDAAKTVAEICSISLAPGGRSETKKPGRRSPRAAAKPPAEPPPTEPLVNEPLSFSLKNLDTEHPFIAERGLTPEMVETFGLGIASRGLMKGRLVFPIHNPAGQLVAYCGRFVGNDVPEDEVKYKQPKDFHKSLELFNWHRVKDRVASEGLVLVESFFGAVAMHTAGYPVAAVMGRSLSAEQLALIVAAHPAHITLLFDGDDPGRAAVTTIGRQLLAAELAVSAPIVAEDFKPHRCPPDELEQLLQV